jgi:hypothetical protein
MCTVTRLFKVIKQLTYSFAFFVILLTSCSADVDKDLRLIVKHYYGGPGMTIVYSIDKDGLQVNTNCDLTSCEATTVYKRTFSEVESDSVIETLNSFQLDTLKHSYKHQGFITDGFFTEIKLTKGLLSSHKSIFDNLYPPTLDRLNTYIDKLVTKPEFRLATWGKTE